MDHIVRGRCHSSLAHGLRNQQKVVALRQGDYVIDNGARLWILVVLENARVLKVKSPLVLSFFCVCPIQLAYQFLVDDYERHAQLLLGHFVVLSQCSQEVSHFVLNREVKLAITNSVTEKEDLQRRERE